jgi:hypothetical protein
LTCVKASGWTPGNTLIELVGRVGIEPTTN